MVPAVRFAPSRAPSVVDFHAGVEVAEYSGNEESLEDIVEVEYLKTELCIPWLGTEVLMIVFASRRGDIYIGSL